MRLSSLYAGAIALALVFGCGAELASEPEGPPQDGISGPDASITFSHSGTLALSPGELTTLSIGTQPPDHYEVTFRLLGDSLGATLDQSVVVADDDGKATVTMRAPNQATTFRVQASVKDGTSAELPVSVSDEGFGTLRVVPIYGGKREITQWSAAAVAKRTCAEIAADLPNDPAGALTATAPGEGAPEIELAPVGPNLAVTLRAGYYAWGCADVTGLVANETLEVKVTVFDKPIDLTVTDLSVEFSWSAEAMPYEALMMDGANRFAEAAFPLAVPESQVLLDTMQAHIIDGDDMTAFVQARQLSADGVAATYFAALPVSLRDRMLAWGTTAVLSQPPVLIGRLQALPEQSGHALLTLETFGTASAAAAGIPTEHLVSGSGQPGDVVLLGGMIFWLPSKLAGSGAIAPANYDFPTATTVPEALDAALDCNALAQSLGPFGSCDATCAAELCRSALAWRHELGLGASAEGGIGTISMAATGSATVSEEATPVSFDGTWVGILTAGELSVGLDGTTSGAPYGEGPN
jgi:hypothetical protein